MATSKLLKPTNVTISIPAFTDQPDQRVNSNCIDKEADAINSLSDQIGALKTGTWVNFTEAASAGITINNNQYQTSGYIIRGGMCFVSLNITLDNAQGDTSLPVVNGLPSSLKNTIKPPVWSVFGAGSQRTNDIAESLFQSSIVYIRNAKAGNFALSFCYPVANP